MTITTSHFVEHSSNPEDEVQKMVIRTGLLNNSLRELLARELQCGNKIFEVTTGWPYVGSVFVLLERRFSKAYQEDTLVYSEINDPHYWFAQYHTKEEPQHLLGCRWEDPLVHH